MTREGKRLPRSAVPLIYELTLTPNFAESTFQGQLVVTVNITEPIDKIELNCANIEINVAEFQGVSAEVNYVAAEEVAQLNFKQKLQEGEGKLTINYNGQISSKMRGLYSCSYTAPSGELVQCGITMLCPTDARRVLPCWDEPDMKAQFVVTLKVQAGLTALSNMPELSRTRLSGGSDLEEVQFAKSPKMSTYLLAIAIGQFDFVEAHDSDGVQLRVYTPIGRKQRGHFALEVARKTLPFYRELFGIAYPLPKLDLIAVPDLTVGAMENWGLVTYREAKLLVDHNSSRASLETVALVVGHELAHQWFGNLVTMQWWTYLWLNEGFASWVEYLCVDHCYPEFDIWTRFVHNDFSKALELDCLQNSHPIEVEVGHPDDIDEIFDAISYSKGASVIRMLHQWLGDAAFKDGLRQYLNKHQYSCASSSDLWLAMSRASGKPVQAVMQAWISRQGFPVISARIDDVNHMLMLRQSRFVLGHAAATAAATAGGSCDLWHVPIELLASDDNHSCSIMMDQREMQMPLPATKLKWLKLNSQCVGVYRVEYSAGMLADLIAALPELSERDRFSLQSDLFALAAAGKVTTASVLELARAYKQERSYTVWSDLLSSLAGVHVLAEALGKSEKWDAFVRELCEPALQLIGWDSRQGESHDAGLLRGLIVGCLGRSGHSGVVAECLSRFSDYAAGRSRLQPDLRLSVYCVATRHGNQRQFEQLLSLLEQADSSEEELRILRGMGSVDDEQLLQRLLQLAMSDRVRRQDAVTVISNACSNLQSRRFVWRFVKLNWQWFVQNYTGLFLLGRLVIGVCAGLCSADDADDVEAFFSDNPAPSAARAVKQATETIRLRANILHHDGDRIQLFLESLPAALRP